MARVVLAAPKGRDLTIADPDGYGVRFASYLGDQPG